MSEYLYLAVGGLVGVFARFFVAGAIYQKTGIAFPWGTLVVNASGCLAIGFFNALAEHRLLLGVNERVLLMTGFCGAYTTFSSLILETAVLAKNGQIGRGLANVAVSLALGFAFFKVGDLAAKIV